MLMLKLENVGGEPIKLESLSVGAPQQRHRYLEHFFSWSSISSSSSSSSS